MRTMTSRILKKSLAFSLLILLSVTGCDNAKEPSASLDELYSLFQDPPSEARPFVRWWWNGDCIEVDGQAYRVTAVKVECEGSSVYSQGDPGTSNPDHTHVYGSSPNQVELWLEPMPQEELENCQGY